MEGEEVFSPPKADPLQRESVFGSEGFKAPRWRTRLTAIEFAVQHCVTNDQLSSPEKTLDYKFCERVLRGLLYDLALQDSQWQVRKAAVESAVTVLLSSKDSLSPSSFAENILGILATCLDPQPDVQETASQCILQQLVPSSSREVQVAVSSLCDRFIRLAVQVDDLQRQEAKLSRRPRREFVGLDNIPGGEVLLAGMTAATCLQLLPLPASDVTLPQPAEVDMVPLLFLVVAIALEDAQKRENRILAESLTRFLRCMGLGVYRRSLLSMLNPRSAFYLPDTSLLKTYQTAGRLDEETADVLRESKVGPALKALAISLDPSGVEDLANHLTATGISYSNVDLCEEGFIVLQQVLEMTHVPSVLTTTLKDETAEKESQNFLGLTYPLLSISKSVLDSNMSVSSKAPFGNELVEGLILCCATFAGGDAEDSSAVLWTTKEHRELAKSLIISLHTFSVAYHAPGSKEVSTEEHSFSECSCSLMAHHLPSLLPRLKQVIKGEAGPSGEGVSDASSSLSSSIVAAHQMEWCLRQLGRQNLASHVSLIMPCVLTAMDHFSREVKGYGMRSLLHVVQNSSAAEFQWNKDVVLDAVCRNLIGSEELWPVAVKLAVTTVTSYEGNNLRSSWYREIFSRMLEELDRQRDVQARRVVWLQEITPQLEAMGLVLVVHFSKLLPLLYHWLHAPDDTTCLLVLARLRTLIISTWPRVPAHMKRLTVEVVQTYYEASSRKAAVDVQTAAVDVLQLLKLCGGQDVAEALKDQKEKCTK
ncbi:hypothetical protein R1sor_002347 [Riccia sorocarpa]|uniref:Uncharacterized protein n=1 Tax=Riccia sorocarpa TaxID=122646 RepID=A0ABD3H1Z4_9MARC